MVRAVYLNHDHLKLKIILLMLNGAYSSDGATNVSVFLITTVYAWIMHKKILDNIHRFVASLLGKLALHLETSQIRYMGNLI